MVGVNLIMTSLDEGGIRCLDQSNLYMVAVVSNLLLLIPQSLNNTQPDACTHTSTLFCVRSCIGLCFLAEGFP